MLNTIKHSFFCQDLQQGELSEEESHHAIKVLRLKEGQPITLLDGKGGHAIAEISSLSKKVLSYKITEQWFHESAKPYLHIAIAPTKNNDRFEFFLEKATEIGIQEITPLLCSNSERKIIKEDRFQKIIQSAVKQADQYYLPQFNPLTAFTDFITQRDENQKFIAHCEDESDKCALKSELATSEKICILIGPEGDFTTEEIKLAKENGFLPVSLGESRLRTETAGIAACHTVRLILSE